MGRFAVREAGPDDLDALLGLYEHLHTADDPLPHRGEVERVWTRMLDARMPIVYLGELDAVPVTSCVLAIIPNLTRAARPYGLIENVVTHRSARRHGFATTVLQHALRYAWELDCYKVMLLTGSKRETTLLFYEQAGFVRGTKTAFVASPPESG